MPATRLGAGEQLVERVRQRMKQELGRAPGPPGPPGPPAQGDDFPPEPYAPQRYRRKDRRSRPSGAGDIRARIREAVNQDPPRLCWATYRAKGATDYKARYLACYSERDRGADGSTLLFAACSADGWAIEAFRYDSFGDFQVTDSPWPFAPQYRIEFQDGGGPARRPGGGRPSR